METGPWLKASSDRLKKQGIKLRTKVSGLSTTPRRPPLTKILVSIAYISSKDSDDEPSAINQSFRSLGSSHGGIIILRGKSLHMGQNVWTRDAIIPPLKMVGTL